ncbi:MAG: hypothetical protein ACKV2V_12670 [Blastocatellia bacterium]
MPKQKYINSRADLMELIEEGTVDCYGVDEEHSGMLTVVQDNVDVPFQARVGPDKVTVTELDFPKSGLGMTIVCERNGKKLRTDLTALDFIDPLPAGYEYIEAFKLWQEGADDEGAYDDGDDDEDEYDEDEDEE